MSGRCRRGDKHAANKKHPTPALQFNGISRGRLHAVSCKDARWVDHEMIGHESEVAVVNSVNNVGLVCDAGGGSSLHQRER